MRRPAAALVVITMCIAGTVVGLPLFAAGGGDMGAGGFCTPGQLGAAGDGSPTIIGTSALTYSELLEWWESSGRGQPSRLRVSVDEVISLYLSEADVEGVRGDLALAQAIHETGWFTSSDTSINNFAGIAHPDGAGSGWSFTDVLTGIRAHVQLLKKYAGGNDVILVHGDVAPDAAARADTWEELAGTWATDRGYWTAISDLHTTMVDHAGRAQEASPATLDGCAQSPPAEVPADGSLVSVRGITVDASIADALGDLLAAAEADGLVLSGSGYRSHQRQIELRRAHCGTSDHAIYQMPSSQCHPPTARPGTSMHERGLAIDFDNCSTRSTRCWQWLNENAATYGFFNLADGTEPWHWSPTAT